ncbi:hypothetical protein RRG08_004662 [Elysia crispata]|uniref:Uncharacterized protein n=1 Tax=Elysia crispata TaxID=231223 RepID=A0AAE0ZNS7_9GAST|nr:hypothetical protein RRG08_004662 [Elysia crispata]
MSISHCKTSLLHPPQYRYPTAQPSYPHPHQYRYLTAQPSYPHPPQYRYLTAQPSYPHPPQYRYLNEQPPYPHPHQYRYLTAQPPYPHPHQYRYLTAQPPYPHPHQYRYLTAQPSDPHPPQYRYLTDLLQAQLWLDQRSAALLTSRVRLSSAFPNTPSVWSVSVCPVYSPAFLLSGQCPVLGYDIVNDHKKNLLNLQTHRNYFYTSHHFKVGHSAVCYEVRSSNSDSVLSVAQPWGIVCRHSPSSHRVSPPNKTPGGGTRDTPKPPFNSYLEFCFESNQPQKAQLLQRVETRVSLEAKYGKKRCNVMEVRVRTLSSSYGVDSSIITRGSTVLSWPELPALTHDSPDLTDA